MDHLIVRRLNDFLKKYYKGVKIFYKCSLYDAHIIKKKFEIKGWIVTFTEKGVTLESRNKLS